jgi:hypothetical protein
MNEIKLRIKSPSAVIPDIYVDVGMDDTILRVKELIRDDYPSHPVPGDQKLVYAGRLLQNQDLVRNVLRFEDECVHYTIHLVCRIKEFQPSSSAALPSENSSLPTNHASSGSGLRQRNVRVPEGSVAVQPQQGMNQTTATNRQSAAANIPSGGQAAEERQLESIHRTLQDLITQTPNLSADELAVYHQLYIQYASLNTQFLHQLQHGGGAGSFGGAVQDNIHAGAAVGGNNNVVGGGEVDNAPGGGMVAVNAAEDNPAANGGVDPLEYAYSILRVAILFCIMYSHSSFFRLLFVLLALAAVYFMRNRNQDGQANNATTNVNNRRRRQLNVDQAAEVNGENMPNVVEEDADTAAEDGS